MTSVQLLTWGRVREKLTVAGLLKNCPCFTETEGSGLFVVQRLVGVFGANVAETGLLSSPRLMRVYVVLGKTPRQLVNS